MKHFFFSIFFINKYLKGSLQKKWRLCLWELNENEQFELFFIKLFEVLAKSFQDLKIWIRLNEQTLGGSQRSLYFYMLSDKKFLNTRSEWEKLYKLGATKRVVLRWGRNLKISGKPEMELKAGVDKHQGGK